MNKLSKSVVALFVLYLVTAVLSETLHVKRCDNYCGGSRLNPFGASGTCQNCCMQKGFMYGGECGDFLTRHCRCNQNMPVYGSVGSAQPLPHQTVPQQTLPQQPYPVGYPYPMG